MSSLDDVQAFLGCTDADLKANRRGQLSREQLERLQMKAITEIRAILFIPALLTLSIFFLMDIGTAFSVMLVLLALMVGIYALHRGRIKTYEQRQVRQVSGNLHKIAGRYAVQVGDEYLPVPPPLYDGLDEGNYSLYLLEGTNTILGVEPFKKRRSRRKSANNKPSTAKTSS
jgi:hypothetical protein